MQRNGTGAVLEEFTARMGRQLSERPRRGIVSKSPTSIVALKDKAEDLRRIARDLGFTHTENAVPDQQGAIRFTFELTQEESLRLVNAVPRDFYAYRAYLR